MDAWETLIAGSTLTSGDAWEHLNAQSGEEPTTGVQPTTVQANATKVRVVDIYDTITLIAE